MGKTRKTSRHKCEFPLNRKKKKNFLWTKARPRPFFYRMNVAQYLLIVSFLIIGPGSKLPAMQWSWVITIYCTYINLASRGSYRPLKMPGTAKLMSVSVNNGLYHHALYPLEIDELMTLFLPLSTAFWCIINISLGSLFAGGVAPGPRLSPPSFSRAPIDTGWQSWELVVGHGAVKKKQPKPHKWLSSHSFRPRCWRWMHSLSTSDSITSCKASASLGFCRKYLSVSVRPHFLLLWVLWSQWVRMTRPLKVGPGKEE